MFALKLVTCVLGIICGTHQVDATYVSAARCHEQGAIIAGIEKVRMPQTGAGTFSWTSTCVDLSDATYSEVKGGAATDQLKAARIIDLDELDEIEPATPE